MGKEVLTTLLLGNQGLVVEKLPQVFLRGSGNTKTIMEAFWLLPSFSFFFILNLLMYNFHYKLHLPLVHSLIYFDKWIQWLHHDSHWDNRIFYHPKCFLLFISRLHAPLQTPGNHWIVFQYKRLIDLNDTSKQLKECRSHLPLDNLVM